MRSRRGCEQSWWSSFAEPWHTVGALVTARASWHSSFQLTAGPWARTALVLFVPPPHTSEAAEITGCICLHFSRVTKKRGAAWIPLLSPQPVTLASLSIQLLGGSLLNPQSKRDPSASLTHLFAPN